MGVIKGSISSADTLTPLSREQYLDTSCRIAPTFTACAEREKVYMIYEHYEILKRDIGDIDQIDRVIAMLRAIKSTPGLSKELQQAFDQVYIDGLILFWVEIPRTKLTRGSRGPGPTMSRYRLAVTFGEGCQRIPSRYADRNDHQKNCSYIKFSRRHRPMHFEGLNIPVCGD